MWSEHCSYKSSRKHLRQIPDQGPARDPGAGRERRRHRYRRRPGLHLQDGEPQAHPSVTSSPIRARRPVTSAASCATSSPWARGRSRWSAERPALRRSDRTPRPSGALVSGVVSGIGGYGNCVGVPTVGGETNFHAGYNGNILVNAMCVGLADADKIFYSAAPEPGLPVVYFGSKTGRDGIHGATMASLGRVRRGQRRKATHGPGRRSLRRKAADRGDAGTDGLRRRRRHPGHGRGGPDLLVLEEIARWVASARAAWASSSTSTPCPSAEEGMTRL